MIELRTSPINLTRPARKQRLLKAIRKNKKFSLKKVSADEIERTRCKQYNYAV